MNIHDDPHTVPLQTLLGETSSRQFVREILGHFFTGPDGFVYRVIGYRENDGPWIEEVLGRTKTRTISMRAIDRTFHHHKKCSVEACRSWSDVQTAGRMIREGGRNVTWETEWSGVQQMTDGRTIWVNAPDGMCIGRLAPAGIDVHAKLQAQQESGQQCLYCETGNAFAPEVTFAQYVRFCTEMRSHHEVEISRALPVRIACPSPLV